MVQLNHPLEYDQSITKIVQINGNSHTISIKYILERQFVWLIICQHQEWVKKREEGLGLRTGSRCPCP
jgi:hypothetical protein